MYKRDIQYGIVYVIIFLLSIVTDWYRVLVVFSFLFTIFITLEKMGRGIVLRELISLHLIFICLFMPLMGYIYFNYNDLLARRWVRYMFISEEDYFSFALPSSIGFVAALCWPLSNSNANDYTIGVLPILEKARKQVENYPWIGTLLIIFGSVMYTVSSFLPVELQFAFQLFYFSAFAGFLYVYYQKNFKPRIWVLVGFSVFILWQTLNSAMFTIIAYMGITLFSFLFLNRKVSVFRKFLAFGLGVFLLFIIQSVKIDYRKYVWGDSYEGSKTALFLELMGNKLSTLGEIDPKVMTFPIYYRTNQGFNVALVMKRMPLIAEFDGGKKLGMVFLSAFVPRFLWPDKPEAGGRENMKYYAGVDIRGYSTNVGLNGEAYGSFGGIGGTIYMILLGLLVRWCYLQFFKISNRLPALLLWTPVLFFQTAYCSETDTLQIINSLVKSALFIWMLYKLFPQIFGRKLMRR